MTVTLPVTMSAPVTVIAPVPMTLPMIAPIRHARLPVAEDTEAGEYM
ncbi:hypothetical protein [Planobispora rosea]|nr:hypothetical protein [Planobispora rosea]